MEEIKLESQSRNLSREHKKKNTNTQTEKNMSEKLCHKNKFIYKGRKI